ncbi:MAG: hypothetical protein VB111_12950 [Clostridiaceae bacterium]|nr:hypothetical protein [Clostridiaceae bacterium]
MRNACLPLVFVFLFIISGCAPSDSPGNTTEFQYQMNFAFNQFTMQESDGGYYCGITNTMFYIDKKTMKPVYLCNKPNCLHADEPDIQKRRLCNAFFTCTSPDMQFNLYKNNLYLLIAVDGPAKEVIRADPDGTNRKTLYRFHSGEFIQNEILHRGQLYLFMSGYDENMIKTTEIHVLDVESSSPELKALYTLEPNEGASNITVYGDYLYFTFTREDRDTWEKLD